MKNLVLFLALFLTLGLFSCKKEVIDPIDPTVEVVEDQEINIAHKTFVLVQGFVYLENMDTGDKTRYDHFDITKKVSGMRLGSFEYPLERLEEDVTTWTFMPKTNGLYEFYLNGDSLNPYEFTGGYGQYSIIEHRNAKIGGDITIKMGGSAKPIQVFTHNYDANLIKIYTHEAYTNIDGVQFTYFNELILQEVI